LVNALLLAQQGDAVAAANSQARVRVVAGATSNAAVFASLSGTTLMGSTIAPALSDYTLVPAGSATPVVTVNGAAVGFATAPSFLAGGDYTLLVYGAPGSASAAVVADDNSLPSDSSKAKLRLVNALGGSLTLKVGLVVKANGIAAGAASDYTLADATTTGSIQVTSADAQLNYNANTLTLLANGVYTVFMLGNTAAPVGQLSRDR
jgi:hypothetical protein